MAQKKTWFSQLAFMKKAYNHGVNPLQFVFPFVRLEVFGFLFSPYVSAI